MYFFGKLNFIRATNYKSQGAYPRTTKTLHQSPKEQAEQESSGLDLIQQKTGATQQHYLALTTLDQSKHALTLGLVLWAWPGIRCLLHPKVPGSIILANNSWDHLTPRLGLWNGRAVGISPRCVQVGPGHHALPKKTRHAFLKTTDQANC